MLSLHDNIYATLLVSGSNNLVHTLHVEGPEEWALLMCL